MKSFKQTIADLLGLQPAVNQPLMPKVAFHKEAAYHGDHGTILVSNRAQRLTEVRVKFAFIGLDTPPNLDLNIMNYIWSQALEQGYIPHSIQRYKGVVEQVAAE